MLLCICPGFQYIEFAVWKSTGIGSKTISGCCFSKVAIALFIWLAEVTIPHFFILRLSINSPVYEAFSNVFRDRFSKNILLEYTFNALISFSVISASDSPSWKRFPEKPVKITVPWGCCCRNCKPLKTLSAPGPREMSFRSLAIFPEPVLPPSTIMPSNSRKVSSF